MACGCGARRKAAKNGLSTVGYVVTFPDGTSTSDSAPFLTLTEARAAVFTAGGGTIRKLVRRV